MGVQIPDWRHIENGNEIPTVSYSDQPYVVQTDDGAWLCTLTTGAGREGQHGQHIVVLRSEDHGHSWSEPMQLESPEGPEASYAVLLKVPTGRVYCLYNYNADNIREVKGDPAHAPDMVVTRVDSLGHYVFRYSDDHGMTWSDERYEVPVREFDIDRENVYGGKIRFFWNVGRPLVTADAAYCSLHKVGGFGDGFFIRSEGVLIKSANILTESDPEQIEWETVPDGEVGLRTPPGGGLVAEEQSYTELSDGTIYAIYRTIDGYPARSLSRDAGHTWSDPAYLQYADGRRVKHPRAANFIWRCEDGRFLYWFHNHGGRFIPEGRARYGGGFPFEDRNPVWLSMAEEYDTPAGKDLRFSEPEIVIYDDDPIIRMSYPDMIEDGGKTYLTETQKDMARVHEVDRSFLDVLFSQFSRSEIAISDCVFEVAGAGKHDMPELPRFTERDVTRLDHGSRDLRIGVTIELWFELGSLDQGQILLDWADDSDRGVVIRTSSRNTLEVIYGDGQTRCVWDCDRGSLTAGVLHHVAFIFDSGPKVLSCVLDGRVHDGGEDRQFGWGRFSPHLRSLEGAMSVSLAPSDGVTLHRTRMYRRALMHTECIGNYHAGVSAEAGIDRIDTDQR